MNDVWGALRDTFQSALETHALAVIAAVLFCEELGVPSPIPGDLLMILAGVRVAQGRESLWAVLLVQQLATLAGTCGLFALSRRFGRRLVTRYGRFIHLKPETLARAEAAIGRYGGRAIVAGRLIPGLRIGTPIAAGTLGLPWRRFLPAVALGAFLYLLFYTLLGLWLGPAALTLFERITVPTGALLSLIATGVAIVLRRRLRRERSPGVSSGPIAASSASLAGLGAGVVALLAVNGVVGVAGFAARPFGLALPPAAGAGGSALRLLLGWPVFLALTGLLGALGGLSRVARLPRVTRGLLVSVPPLALTLLVYELVERRGGGVRGDAFLLAVEILRWLAFGVLLDEALPLAGGAPLAESTPTTG